MVASRPPGVQTTLSPSTRGDSEYCQPPEDPLKSLTRSTRHFCLPSARPTQTNSPCWPRAKTLSPSTVGVHRGPGYPPPPPPRPTLAFHRLSPFLRLTANT